MSLGRDELIAKLAASMGQERATELVAETLTAVGDRTWTDSSATRVIEKLAQAPGLVGAAARRLRASEARSSQTALPRATPSSGVVVTGSPTLSKLVTMLGATLGEAKAAQLVDEAAGRRGIAREAFSKDDALVVLEDLAREPGLVGTVARFAKARAHFELV